MTTLFIALLTVLIFVSGLLSASETALFSLSSMRVKACEVGKDVRGHHVARLLKEPRKLLVTILMLNVLMNILVQNVVATLFGEQSSWLINVGVPLILTLILGEMIPKALAFTHNMWIALHTASFFVWIERILGPVRNVITKVTVWVSRTIFFFLRTQKEIEIEELKVALVRVEEQEIMGAEEAKLVRGYLNLAEDRVKEVMRPRSEMMVYDKSEPLEKLVSLFVDEEISRIPVTEGSSENIVGIVHAAQYFADGKIELRAPFFVPESTSGKMLLQQFYASNEELAIVVDEYGAVAGLITREDLVELVLGQIADRRDIRPHYTSATKDIIIATGQLELVEFEEIFGVHLDSIHNMATIGGFLTEMVGDIPKMGDKLTIKGFLFHILSADQTHVRRIYIRRLKK